MSFQDVGRPGGGSPKWRTAATSTTPFSSASAPGADDRGHARRSSGRGGGTLGGVSGGFGQVSDYIVQYQVRRRGGNCEMSFLKLFQN
jgi:hypothetical protein